ncbi:tyrosine-protein kinase family protein [Lactiplantibacillus paraxiangfangensis]|uniref:tyrosine-protein kinase family protein n=1 Tax=Lactiplantibacillus paraxiangfangensis TaxID=3076224 RepID=UPI0030C70F6A
MNNVKEIKETIRRINGSLAAIEDRKGIITFANLSGSLVQRTIVANLAIMYGRANMKVLIVDTDFKQNSFLEVFHINNSLGLSDYLNDSTIKTSEITNEVLNQNVAVISSGSLDLDDTHYLLDDPRFELLIGKSSNNYDLILINTATVKKYDEFKNVCKRSDGIILVTEPKTTHKRALFSFFRQLMHDEVRVLGYINAKKLKK